MEDNEESRAFAKAYFIALNIVDNLQQHGATHPNHRMPDYSIPKSKQMQEDMDRIMHNESLSSIQKVNDLTRRLKDTNFGKFVYTIAILENDHGASERQMKAEAQAEAQALMKLKTIRDASAIQAASAALPLYYASLDKPMSAIDLEYQRTHPSGTYVTVPVAAAAPLANPLTIAFHKSKKRGGKKSYKKSHKKSHKRSSHKKKSHRRRH